jgi:hypothetical protein
MVWVCNNVKTIRENLPSIWVPQGLRDQSMHLHTEDIRFMPKKSLEKKIPKFDF